ncbi:hypothetical protein BDV95DRAFT_602872 [Massariosphaeria phaeospora]|uniref:Uncharacterized protein n=1 Tax=Massariosphaeria phaeospora TaxID=100035 RepID=A0A7C8MAH9_9PLEO|nr:hypothetical protein BDV95DRAFT_602872 [Massariosphaeria phaeospora]
MESRPTSPLPHPMMLDDLRRNCQHISAILPPDGWDDRAPKLRLERQASGILNVCPSEVANGARAIPKVDDVERRGPTETQGLLTSINEERDSSPQKGTRKGRRNFWEHVLSIPRLLTLSHAMDRPAPRQPIHKRLETSMRGCWPFSKRESKKWSRGERTNSPGGEPLL